MEEIPTAKATEVVKLMDEDKLIERLPEMTAGKLHEIDPQTLFDNLLKVPVEHLIFEVPPTVDPTLPLPVAVQVTPTLAIYTVSETGELVWGKLVGSPSPLHAILGKFTRSLSNIQITITDLDQLTSTAPTFGADTKINSFFSIDVVGADPEDVAAAHVTMFVEQAWLDDNNVHKWSIQFNRLNAETNTWVTFSTKRIASPAGQESRVFYSLVVPGFSVIAVTGSEELSEEVFEVTGLQITPPVPQAGDDVTVSANVTNTGSTALVYPANIWLDNTIEQTKTISVGAGQTEAIEFTISDLADGTYSVRIERLLGQFVVGIPSATPVAVIVTATPPSPTPIAVPATATRTPTSTPRPATPVPTATATATATVAAAVATATTAPATQTPAPTATATVVPTAIAPVAPTPTAPVAPTPTTTPTVPEEDGGGGAVMIIIVVLVVLAAIGGGVFLYLRQQGMVGGPPVPPSPGVPPTPSGPTGPGATTEEPEEPTPPDEETEEERPSGDDDKTERRG